jgi:U3 small nucleolar RNA-associated protein 19
MPEKARFLKLLDLSLRSPKLPSSIIAAFVKRMARITIQYGQGSMPEDIQFTISLIVNLMKRHPNVKKLIHRKTSSASFLKRDCF